MLYLSLGSISASVGISAFQRSINFIVSEARGVCWLEGRGGVRVEAVRAFWAVVVERADVRRPGCEGFSEAVAGDGEDALGGEDSAELDRAATDDVAACRFSAVSSTETILSTRRMRRRCRSFWGGERRQGIFLREAGVSTRRRRRAVEWVCDVP